MGRNGLEVLCPDDAFHSTAQMVTGGFLGGVTQWCNEGTGAQGQWKTPEACVLLI